jgi:hypothetical protein
MHTHMRAASRLSVAGLCVCVCVWCVSPSAPSSLSLRC